MKIAYLAAQTIHTVRWVNALAQRGHDIFLITMHSGDESLHENVQLFKLPFSAPSGYFLNAPFLKRLLKRLQPDWLHVHYATGYGALGRLSRFSPLILSVWGSDVFDFPTHSRWHKAFLVKNLANATQICSTSYIMAATTQQLCGDDKAIAITPFGIDTSLFYPRPELRDQSVFKIGTVKTLAPQYGIDTLIRAFYQLRSWLQDKKPLFAPQLRLCIAGDGQQRAELQALVTQLGLETVTEFAGHLPHAQVPIYLNQLDVYVAASRSESFGVAILEASACGLPVVVSRVGGLPEVVEEGVTGLLADKDQVEQFAAALFKLVQDKSWRENLGKAGRQYVIDNYDWQESVVILETVYTGMVNGSLRI
jgi:glycosyltransferase involved in cell wall biosynthesis